MAPVTAPMPARPDYTSLRDPVHFGWSAYGSQGALRQLTGIPIREFNLVPEACIEAYRRGRPLLREMFGEEVGLPGVCTPAVSYGHVNCLGCELLFPEGGEVAHAHLYGSLAQGLRALQESADFATAGMAPFYLDFRERMQAAFPDESVGFSFGAEGPITTAYELRGEGFFTDILDDPPGARDFLRAATDSILDYHRWTCALEGREPISPTGAGMCDDVASFIPPRLFGEVVLPAWEQYFSGMTAGSRHAHVEDLRPAHLPFLEQIGLSDYDPSISPRLTPPLIRDGCRVPFTWRLECFHCREMSLQDVEDFVFQAAADGAGGVSFAVAEMMCTERGVAQIHAFIAAAKEVARLLAEGMTRRALRERVSPQGREILWERWCGYLGPESTRGGAKTPTRELQS